MIMASTATRHARERFAARSIPPLVAELILEFGECQEARDGACKYALSKDGMRRIRKAAGRAIADEVDRFRRRNVYVVAAGERIVTAAFSAKPLFA